MSESAVSVVICEACKGRVAEIIASDGRSLCSECHLAETGTRRPPKDEIGTKE